MSHFFVNLDKLLYSFKKKSLVLLILLNLKVRGTFNSFVVTCLHPPSVCCEGCKEKVQFKDILGRYLEGEQLVSCHALPSPPEEVGVDVGEAVVLGQWEQDTRRTATVTLAAEAAVADATAGRTLPLLERNKGLNTQPPERVKIVIRQYICDMVCCGLKNIVCFIQVYISMWSNWKCLIYQFIRIF